MPEKKIEWTKQQQQAIQERGRDVLVTASAGTGKTAVLSGRAVDIVGDKNICPDVWSILVLTFTDAAAEQMRQRIAEQLVDAYRRTKDEHLARQLALLQGADISTIHSFCKRLITEHFYELELDPAFGIIDADEQQLLKGQVLQQAIDWAWDQPNLAPLLEELLAGRDIRPGDGFLGTIIEISDFLDGVVWRNGWYEKAVKLCENINVDDNTAEKQKQIVKLKLDEILMRLTQAGRIYERHNGDGSWMDRFVNDYAAPVKKLEQTLRQQGWDSFARLINTFERPRVYAPKDVDDDIREIIRAEIKEAFAILDEVKRSAILNPDYLAKIGSAANRQTLILIELVKKFENLYAQAKRALNRLDFADLERYALQLLAEQDSLSDKPQSSAVALNLREKYRYVFVDEYQDINPVQKAILDLLAGEGNTFVVGDVKQSIYAFRGAEPRIFIEDLKTASAEPKDKAESRRVDLNWNFRSAKDILDFVNLVFGRLMSKEFGAIEYDEGAMLRCAFDEEANPQAAAADEPRVELHLLEDEIEQEQQEEQNEQERTEPPVITARQRQAAMIAQRIRRMVGADTGQAEFKVYDKQTGVPRSVEYRDIVVLMRSLAKRANTYVEVLQLAGVPVSCAATAGYFEATEISDCLCLLKVLDNPRRDIELAAVLRSPIFRVSDTALAKIRLFSKKTDSSFYDCVTAYAKNGQDKQLSQKLQQALADIERWRTEARAGSIADLLWQIYRQSGLLAFYSALPGGSARRANLLKLHDRAIQFESFAASRGSASLGRFVGFIEQLQEAGAEWAGAEPEDSAANAVWIMSVHKSKGLEFPVVFIAELDGQFNFSDLQKDVLLGLDVPLGLAIIDRSANAKLSTAPYQVLEGEKLDTSLAEELRILYVAMTRARERLVLTASAKRKKCEMILRKGFEFGAGAIAPWQLADCRSSLDWLLYGLSNHKLLHETFETGIRADGDETFDLKLYAGCELTALSQCIVALKKAKQPKKTKTKRATGKSGLLESVKKSLGWKYESQAATVLPTKQSVTQLTHYNDEFVQLDYSRSLQRRPGVVLSDELKKELTVEGRVVGTAAHLIISSIDLGKQVNPIVIRRIADELIGKGLICTEAMECIDIESIARFFESELGRMALDSNNKVRREWPFTFSLPVSELDENAGSDDSIVVQGIVDMLIETLDGLVVIDFKTDRVSEGQIEKRTELYTKQVQLYARAAEKILKKPVLSKWLYFLSVGKAVEIVS
jgi:ATP-dependent helicase/nuclease subunit A